MSLVESRIDKWLWAARFFKTRALAVEACKADHIKIDERCAKPASLVRPHQIVEVRLPDITRTVRVKELPGKRIGAKLLADHLDDLTPLSEYERQKEFRRSAPAKRERGSGRPTKKERRETDRFFGV